MHFGVHGKAIRDCIVLYNNVGLMSSGSNDVATESPENRRFQLPHCRLTHPFRGTPANIRISHCQILESLRYIFVADSVGHLHSNFRGGLRKTHVFSNSA